MPATLDLPRIKAVVDPLMDMPWRRGACGPQAFDCWNLMAHVERELAGRSVPWITDPPAAVRELVPFILHHPHRAAWSPVIAPSHLCLVEMAHHKHAWHIGVYLDVDGGGVLHTRQGAGVSFDRLLTLDILGFRNLTFHDWNG